MKEIYESLRKEGIGNSHLQEEYFDHYMTQLEIVSETNKSSEEALKEIKLSISKLNGLDITWTFYKTHHKNKLIMASLFIAFISYLLFPFSLDYDPPSIPPVEIQSHLISSTFGNRIHPETKLIKFHKGLDIKGKIGDNVIAPSDGIVIESGQKGGIGFYIVIKHDEVYSSRYHHLSKISVSNNQRLQMGDKIGEVGSSGWSTGPHLHYEVLMNGKNVDPASFLGA